MDEKEHYEELTKKQAAIVDAYAEHPSAGDKSLANYASDKLEDESVSRSYVKPVLDRYEHIARDRKLQLDNQRANGNEETIFEPFRCPEGTLRIELSKSDMRSILNGELPEGLQEEIVERLISRA